MISSRLGKGLDKFLSPIAKKINVHPNVLTITGFLITALAGIVISRDLAMGGVLIIAGSVFDMLDGAVARVNKKVTDFGAFLDSVLDRYSDAFLFLAVAWYLRENPTGILLSIGTLIGAFLVSYARARAEGLGKECKTGIMERAERIILLAFGALTGWIIPALGAMFVLTHITVLQRIFYVYREMSKRVK